MPVSSELLSDTASSLGNSRLKLSALHPAFSIHSMLVLFRFFSHGKRTAALPDSFLAE
jgi:hypothetical protein